MKAEYRLVHFVPDPYSGARIPIAALVRDGDSLAVAYAPFTPTAECLGSVPLAATLESILHALDGASFAALPVAVGPHAVLDVPRAMPAGVGDASKWLVENILPRRDRLQPENVDAARPHRGTEGFRFFETWKVDAYVRKAFRPTQDWGTATRKATELLPSISHYVAGSEKTLLMEPLAPLRRSFQREVADVVECYAAYRWAMDKAETRPRAELLAYFLGGGSARDRKAAMAHIEPVADRIIDTSAPKQRTRFVDEIRGLGQSTGLAV